jgi:hypothetical protein
MHLVRSLVAVAAIAFPGFAMAARVTSDAEACAVLMKAVPGHVQLRSAPSDYYCELRNASQRYYVFAFRSRHPEPPGAGPDWVGSNLVGWFAVRRSDGAALEWNMAKDGPGAVFASAKVGATK